MTSSPQDRTESPVAAAGPRRDPTRPAAVAAAHVSRAGLVLGGLGLASAIIVIAGMLESWRVTSRVTPHHVSILGQTISYPTANAEALVMVLLGALGAVVTARTISGAVREVRSSRRFHRCLAAMDPRPGHGALLIADAQPRAFCAGLLRPQIYVSSGAVAILDRDALDAVLAHERHHARRRDPLRLATGRVLARALFFLPQIGDLVQTQQALAELSADESAVHAAPENRSALARAMLSFSDAPGSAGAVGVDPVRVDYLLGEATAWRFPALVCVAAAALLALLAAVGVLVGQLASGSASLAIPFLSRQPCIVVLAAVPVTLGLFATTYRRRTAPRAASYDAT